MNSVCKVWLDILFFAGDARVAGAKVASSLCEITVRWLVKSDAVLWARLGEMVTLAAACNCHNGEHHHIHDRHDATELSGACSAGARLQPAGDGSLFVLPANDRILVRDLVLRRGRGVGL